MDAAGPNKSDLVTIWGSVQQMIFRALEQQRGLSLELNVTQDTYYQKHYEDETQECLDTATLLDPRFKTSCTHKDKPPNIKARV